MGLRAVELDKPTGFKSELVELDRRGLQQAI